MIDRQIKTQKQFALPKKGSIKKMNPLGILGINLLKFGKVPADLALLGDFSTE